MKQETKDILELKVRILELEKEILLLRKSINDSNKAVPYQIYPYYPWIYQNDGNLPQQTVIWCSSEGIKVTG